MAHKRSSTTFYCFSPPVMLATFTIETCLAVYTVWRYRLTALGWLAAATLVFLALFQLCEYFVCGGLGMSSEAWSRAGYVAISTLPPFGLHIIHELAGKPRRRLVAAAYGTMAAFIAYFLAYQHAFTGYQCTGNYVIFQLGLRPSYAYGLYYYGWLITALVLGMRWANELLAEGAGAHRRLLAVRGLIVGYMVFLVPTAMANSVKPETRSGIPSIMCGFAVLFALILTLYIMPKAVASAQPVSAERHRT